MILVATLSFTLGFLVGIITIGLLVAYQINRLDKTAGKKLEEDIRNFSKEMEKVAFVKVQFKEANRITDKQMELLGSLERPNASASHARYKNQILQQVKDLEEKKIEIFKSILDTGIDPVISMFTPDNGKVEMRMSDALKRHEGLPDTNSKDKTDPNSPRGTVVPLRIVKEENEDESKPRDRTVH